MGNLKIFAFGYYGWGNSTPQLIQAVDSVERSRGYKRPIFVDIRIQRSGRAPGFVGNLFGELLGMNRHHWMKSLGNKRIKSKSGAPIQIAEPETVNELLDHAIEAAQDGRRIIFFCGCQYPKYCHRTAVASLLIKAAKKRAVKLEVVEWPGDEAKAIDYPLSSTDYTAYMKGKCFLPAVGMKLCDAAGIPWGSVAKIVSEEGQQLAVIGPSLYRFQEWQVEVRDWAETKAAIHKKSARFRKEFGYNSIYSY